MISEIFQSIGDVITSFAGVLGNGFTSLIAIFWDSTLNSGAGGLTTIGILSLIGLGMALVMWGFRLIRSLFHARG